jgi:hypothetical protein
MARLRWPLLAILFVLAAKPSDAALFGGPEGLDPAFCKIPTVRQTVVYIDDMMMTDGQTEWAQKLSEKLRASLEPGERVTVVRLSPANAQSNELWSGCWPAYTKDQEEQFARQNYFFSRNPLDSLGDQQKYFMGGFGSALTQIYNAAKRPVARVRFDASAPPQKQLLRALASDEGRFTDSSVPVRAIVYSDMMENSDLGSVFKPEPVRFPNYASILGSHLRQGFFYTYGVGSDISGGQSVGDSAKAYWTKAFKSLTAVLAGFGADLNVANRVPVRNSIYNAELIFHDRKLAGKLWLLTDADGNLVDSSIGFAMLTVAGLDGTFRCKGEDCVLDAQTTSSLITSNIPNESFTLAGSAEALTGRLGVKGTNEMFDVRASVPN